MGPNETQTQEVADAVVDEQPGEAQAGGASQQDGPSGNEANGAQTAGRTYTQAEVDTIQSDMNRERNDNRQALSEAGLRADVAEAERAEQRAMDGDRQRVVEGEITQAEADSRSQGRIRNAGEGIRAKVIRGQEAESMQQVRQQTNEMARLLKTQEAAKANDVDMDELVKWVQEKNPTHPDQIDLQAERMALAKEKADLKGTETYDSNRPTTRGVSTDSLSAMEKISKGVANM